MRLRYILCHIILFPLTSISQTIPWLAKETITGAHDPTVVKDERGVYSLLVTNNLLQIRQSNDLINWQNAGSVISKVPAYMTGVDDIWAPQISLRNGRYWVYYCGSSFGTNNSWIGVASSATLNTTAANYGWTDHGQVIRSTTADNYNCIDPELIVDLNNKVWLAFGSFWSGIKMIAIDPATGLQLSSDKTVYAIAGRGGGAIEGPSLTEHNGYYYLFTAWDKCCDGIKSTYHTMAGRSKTINGSYLDKSGKALTASGGTQVLGSYDRYIGPGGGSAFKDGRRTYFAHHYYNADKNGEPDLQVREVVFDNSDWPHITQPFLGRRQSFEAEHADLNSATIVSSSAASNAEYVGGLTGADSKVVFHINALQSGEYTLRIRFSSPSGVASHFLKINDAAETEVTYPASPASVDFPEGRVLLTSISLTEGYNIISFTKGNGTAHLDRIDLIRNAENTLEAGSFDQSQLANFTSAGNNASFSNTGWAQFENINFDQGEYDKALISFSGSCNGQLKISMDAANGSASTTAALSINTATANYLISLPSAITGLKGIHDLYLTFTGTEACAVDNMRFVNSKVAGSLTTSVQERVLIYPNPFTDSFEMLSTEEISYEVTDLMGKLIHKGWGEGITHISDIYNKGIYLVHITLDGQTFVKKIVKN